MNISTSIYGVIDRAPFWLVAPACLFIAAIGGVAGIVLDVFARSRRR